MFVRSVVLLPFAVCAVRLFSVKTVAGWMDARPEAARAPARQNQQETHRLAQAARRMMEAASRYGLARGNCLSKSLVLWRLLRREGVVATLRVGGRKEGKQFEAHAWVELDGFAINDSGGLRDGFVPFDEGKSGAWIGER